MLSQTDDVTGVQLHRHTQRLAVPGDHGVPAGAERGGAPNAPSMEAAVSWEDVGGRQRDVRLRAVALITVPTKHDVWRGEEVDDKVLSAEVGNQSATTDWIYLIVFVQRFFFSILSYILQFFNYVWIKKASVFQMKSDVKCVTALGPVVIDFQHPGAPKQREDTSGKHFVALCSSQVLSMLSVNPLLDLFLAS